MRSLAEFVKTTLIGGLLIILPIYVSVILIAKAVQGIVAAMKPITAVIPASVQFREIVAVLVIVAVCFVAGLIVRTGPGLRAKNAFEGAVLERLPGYTLLRGLAGQRLGFTAFTRPCARVKAVNRAPPGRLFLYHCSRCDGANYRAGADPSPRTD